MIGGGHLARAARDEVIRLSLALNDGPFSELSGADILAGNGMLYAASDPTRRIAID